MCKLIMIFEFLSHDMINKFSHDVATVAFCEIVALNIAFWNQTFEAFGVCEIGRFLDFRHKQHFIFWCLD